MYFNLQNWKGLTLKNFIIDTNVLLQDPESIYKFDEHNVIIPIGVIEELDRFKKDSGELGRNARKVSRELDELRQQGDLRKGVKVNSLNGTLRVLYNGSLGGYKKEANIDLHVIHIAQKLKRDESDIPCIIVSKDINVRIRADALGLFAENYLGNFLENEAVCRGFLEIQIDSNIIDLFTENEKIEANLVFGEDVPNANYYVLMKDLEGDKQKSAMAKVSPDRLFLTQIKKLKQGIKIHPKNLEQTFAFDALLDPDIKLVCLIGPAGTGKTLLASGVGWYCVEKVKHYDKMLISRPIQPMGRDLGYLPGDLNEKLDPWMQPIYDALEIIHGKSTKGGDNSKAVVGKEIAKQSNRIFIEPLTYIRGRSIHNQFVIVDEAQNLSPLELKTIISRAGENTKIVLTGDIDQIDNPYVDRKSNGLSVVANSFLDCEIAAHIVMSKGVRSQLSEEATKRL